MDSELQPYCMTDEDYKEVMVGVPCLDKINYPQKLLADFSMRCCVSLSLYESDELGSFDC